MHLSAVRRLSLSIRLIAGAFAVASLLCVATPSGAQTQTPAPVQPLPASPAAPSPTSGGAPIGVPASADANKPDPVAGTTNDRIFGVLPNYGTVEGPVKVDPITNRQAFKMAALDSFDPFMYPLFGFVAGVAQLQDQPASYGRSASGYGKRYGVAFADNTVCGLVTTGIMPSLLKTDPRYFQLGKGRFVYRLGYSASRSVVTHTRKTGHRTFNIAEVAGTLVVASISNLYYPAAERNVPATFGRWGNQAMWDTVANELKEFWPDIRRKLHRG